MSTRCVCCCTANERVSAKGMRRWRSVAYECMTGRNRPPGATTSCWGTIRSWGRGRDERQDSFPTTGNDPAVCQAVATIDHRWTVSGDGRTSDQREAESSELSGSTAGSGGGRARRQFGSAADQRGALSQGEDAGGVSVLRGAAPIGGASAEVGRGGVSEPERARHLSGRSGNRKDALGSGAGGGCLSAEKASTFYDGSEVGERTQRSQEQQRTESGDESVDAV